MKKSLIVLIAFLAWFAVVFQYVLILQKGEGSAFEITIRFFSYFTILTNLLVALSFTGLLLGKNGFFTRAPTLTATAVYIFVVGVVYNVILRFQWSPQGWQRVVDEILHSAVPLLVLCYWLAFVPKGQFSGKHILLGLIYPAVYCIWIMIRGSMMHEYPYPFVDVNVQGGTRVALNCLGLCGVFFGLFVLYAAIDRLMKKA